MDALSSSSYLPPRAPDFESPDRSLLLRQACDEEKLLGHLGVVLYEYLGEEYPEVLGSILGALKGIVNVIGMTRMTPPIKDLLPRLTPILKNRHEKARTASHPETSKTVSLIPDPRKSPSDADPVAWCFTSPVLTPCAQWDAQGPLSWYIVVQESERDTAFALCWGSWCRDIAYSEHRSCLTLTRCLAKWGSLP